MKCRECGGAPRDCPTTATGRASRTSSLSTTPCATSKKAACAAPGEIVQHDAVCDSARSDKRVGTSAASAGRLSNGGAANGSGSATAARLATRRQGIVGPGGNCAARWRELQRARRHVDRERRPHAEWRRERRQRRRGEAGRRRAAPARALEMGVRRASGLASAVLVNLTWDRRCNLVGL